MKWRGEGRGKGGKDEVERRGRKGNRNGRGGCTGRGER